MQNPIPKLAVFALALSLACSGGGDKGPAVTGVTLNKNTLTLAAGGSESLVPTVQPPDAGNKAVTWKSSADAVATVSGAGLVTVAVGAEAGGTATITVTTADGGKTATCAVTVAAPVSGVAMGQPALALPVGASATLTAAVQPQGAAPKAVAWSSSLPSVVSVAGVAGDGGDGLSATVTAGHINDTATITVTADGKTATCLVTVVTSVTGVSLDKGSALIRPGRGATLMATVLPETASDKTVAWSSSNLGVATVNNGLVRAVAVGAATITVTTADGGHTANCAVTVEASPVTMPPVTIAAGGGHSLAIKADGGLWAWGRNDYGQLGDGTNASSGPFFREHPLRVNADTDWVSVAGGLRHSVALKADGSLWTWGRNDLGQLGDGTDLDHMTPVQVGAGYAWAMVSAGDMHNVAIKDDGSLWAWGFNYYGQLGIGTGDYGADELAPVRVGTGNDWAAAAAGGYHTLGVKTDGSVWVWGYNEYGALGNGTASYWPPNPIPVRVGTAADWASASGGWCHTVVIKTDGALWAWGYNLDGTLGDGTTTNRHIPVRIGTANDWVSVSGGEHHTLAIRTGGALWSWGDNLTGQLGLGDNAKRNAPARVGADADWAAVSASDGSGNSVALKTDGSLWSWGDNYLGSVGDGTTTERNAPVKVGEGFRVP